jgi:hypothetical protein
VGGWAGGRVVGWAGVGFGQETLVAAKEPTAGVVSIDMGGTSPASASTRIWMLACVLRAQGYLVGLGVRVQGLGFRVQPLWNVGLIIYGLGLRV